MAQGQITPTFILQFGLVNVPVKSYVVNDEKSGFSMRNLHRPCALGQTRVSPESGEMRPRAFATMNEAAKCSVCQTIIVGPRSSPDVIKGFEVDDGDFVTFTAEEIKALESERSKTMEITGFVPISTVDAKWFRGSHFLGSTEQSVKVFALLRETMQTMGVGALVKYNGYGHDKVGIVRAVDDCMILHECYMPDQARTFTAQNRAPKHTVVLSDQERALAAQLVEAQVVESFDLSPFSDGFRKRVDELIQARKEGRTLELPSEPAAAPASTDLLAALTASLQRKAPAPAPSRDETAAAVKTETKTEPKKRARKAA